MAEAAPLGSACAHCGLVVPFERRVGDGVSSYCCLGCETAAGILRAGGLGQYYALGELRPIAVRPTGRDYAEFDHPAFADLYVRRTVDGRAEVELYLEGVHCASCVWLVERIPLIEHGIASAELDLPRSRARVAWDPVMVPLSAVARLLDRLGYPPHPFHGVVREEMRRREDRAALLRIGVAGALAGNVMLMAFALYAGDASGMATDARQLFRWGSFLLTVPALLFPGRVFLAGAWAALRSRALHMDVPIALALVAATARGAINTITATGPVYFDGVTLLIFLLLVGRYLQQRGQRAAADAAELLHALTPRMARVVADDGSLRETPIEALLPGMEVAVAVGDTFPADGAIASGTTTVNTALLTGESDPVAIGPGEAVFAGTENVAAPVRFVVEAAGSASRLSRLLREVEEGARRRAPVVALANRLAGVFVALVLGLAVLTFVLWVGRDSAAAWDHAIALLVVTCPCALALATPLAVSVGIGRAARSGILIKGGDALEGLARPGILVLDKTGTVTEGCHALVAWHGDPAMRPLVLALEEGSRHPVAGGFRRAWPGVAPAVIDAVRHDAEGGITGRWREHAVTIGSPRFVAARAAGVEAWRARLGSAPLTPVLLAIDGAVVAVAGFGDPVRDDAAKSLAALRAARVADPSPLRRCARRGGPRRCPARVRSRRGDRGRHAGTEAHRHRDAATRCRRAAGGDGRRWGERCGGDRGGRCRRGGPRWRRGIARHGRRAPHRAGSRAAGPAHRGRPADLHGDSSQHGMGVGLQRDRCDTGDDGSHLAAGGGAADAGEFTHGGARQLAGSELCHGAGVAGACGDGRDRGPGRGMSVLFIVVPLAMLIVAAAVGAWIWSVRSGQYDDLDTPAVRMLHDDDEAPSQPRPSGRGDAR